MLTTITRTAPAKVNLCLRVVGRRADGYHLLDSIFAAVDLRDRVTISAARTTSATRISIACDYPGVPTDDTNLAARAARSLLDYRGVSARVEIAIAKRVPPGAGLGGGSSNAAAVLVGLAEALTLDLSMREFASLALPLGADVPFFLTGGCARVRGIGEDIAPIPGWPGRELVIAIPRASVSTTWAFRRYAAGYASDPEEPVRMAASRSLDPALMRNDLEQVVLDAYPEIAAAKRNLLAAGAHAAVMSGSGAAVVGLCPPGVSAQLVRDTFAAAHPDVIAHRSRILSPAQSVIC